VKILHVDTNHPLIIQELSKAGFENFQDYTSSKKEIEDKIHKFDGVIIRSRFSIDQSFLDKAGNLKFIGRVGAGLENIDCDYAKYKGVELIAAPEGNRNAVAEHTLGMLLSLFNKLNKADGEVRKGYWYREKNRGLELDGKTIGIIGYGNMGKAFAKKLCGFNVTVLFYDLRPNISDKNAVQVSLEELKKRADILSIHTPETELTKGMVNLNFINAFKKPIWIINTARGKNIVTKDLVTAMKSGKVLGAGLDVLEYEKSSFEDFFENNNIPKEFKYLIESEKTILSPHIAGWTEESKITLAKTIVHKIINRFSAFT
tara:strand:+ start:17800 stop:18747 length:948 start_codon:yes stop_codon:yes gene_type:complete